MSVTILWSNEAPVFLKKKIEVPFGTPEFHTKHLDLHMILSKRPWRAWSISTVVHKIHFQFKARNLTSTHPLTNNRLPPSVRGLRAFYCSCKQAGPLSTWKQNSDDQYIGRPCFRLRSVRDSTARFGRVRAVTRAALLTVAWPAPHPTAR
jgi:hypothetical protein